MSRCLMMGPGLFAIANAPGPIAIDARVPSAFPCCFPLRFAFLRLPMRADGHRVDVAKRTRPIVLYSAVAGR